MARSEMPCASLPGPIRRPSRGACATAAIAATPVRSRDAARRCVGRKLISLNNVSSRQLVRRREPPGARAAGAPASPRPPPQGARPGLSRGLGGPARVCGRGMTAAAQPCGGPGPAIHFAFAAFYDGLKSKVGLAAAAKTAAMRINLNIDGCGVVTPPVYSSSAPLLLANLLAHNPPLARATQKWEVASLIRTVVDVFFK